MKADSGRGHRPTIHRTLRWSMPLALSLASAACVTVARTEPFDLAVRGPADSCTMIVAARTVTTDELLAIARTEAKARHHARILSDMGETPYRCIGGAIYTLQQAGFTSVEAVTEPATAPR